MYDEAITFWLTIIIPFSSWQLRRVVWSGTVFEYYALPQLPKLTESTRFHSHKRLLSVLKRCGVLCSRSLNELVTLIAARNLCTALHRSCDRPRDSDHTFSGILALQAMHCICTILTLMAMYRIPTDDHGVPKTRLSVSPGILLDSVYCQHDSPEASAFRARMRLDTSDMLVSRKCGMGPSSSLFGAFQCMYGDVWLSADAHLLFTRRPSSMNVAYFGS